MSKTLREYIRIVESIYEGFDVNSLDLAYLTELSNKGFDVENVLYHGTNNSFKKFSGRSYIFTSPDVSTACYYGKVVYACFAKESPQADLSLESPDYKLLGKLADVLAGDYENDVKDDEDLVEFRDQISQRLFDADENKDEYSEVRDYESDAEDIPEYQERLHKLAREHVIELITSGSDEVSGFSIGSSLQTDLLDECFRQGYRSVFLNDRSYDGASESVVFNDPTNIVIIGRVR